MFRMWGKIFTENHLIKDTVITIEDNSPNQSLSRTAKVYHCLEQICYEFDLQKPIWLDLNKKDFIRSSKCRFNQDSFIETVDFDFLEMQIIEEG